MASEDTKKLIPILVIVGVLMCGCIALPVVGGVAMFAYWGMAHHADVGPMDEAMADDSAFPAIPSDFGSPTIPAESAPSDFGGGHDAKQAAYQRMLTAEAEWNFAQAQYEAAQGAYEQQRNFNNAQAGRLGAQGISLPPPQPPDPSLSFNAQAAQQRYEAAKAEYESLK